MPQPAGRFVGRIVGGVILIVIGAAILAGALALASAEREAAVVALVVGLVLSLILVLPGIHFVRVSKADTPQHALLLFYKAIGRGNAKGARKLVVPNDLDDFPRFYPEQPDLGRGGMPPYTFERPEGFPAYWKGLVRYPVSPYCIVRVGKARVERIGPDLAVAEFELKLGINTSLWLLLVLVALLIAMIVDLATRKRVQAPMRKILVKVGDEWHLFSGEWQGPEEDDVGWLEEGGARGP